MRRAVVIGGVLTATWATIRFVPPVNRAVAVLFYTRLALPARCTECGHVTLVRRTPHLIQCPRCGHDGYAFNDLSERPPAYVRDWPIAQQRWEAIHAPCA
jgi:DNA-directed RNA polymerase subunit RPC12/RpoP